MEQNRLPAAFLERRSKLAALKKLVSGQRAVTSISQTCGRTKLHTKAAPGRNKKVRRIPHVADTAHAQLGRRIPHVADTAQAQLGRRSCRQMAADTCSSQPIEDASLQAAKRHTKEVFMPQTLSPSKRINSRCVMLHPSRMPPVSHLRSLVLSDSCKSDEVADDVRWPEGQLLWGKIRGYPFWPCMVSKDPFSKLFTKTLGSWKTSRSYHVQFFGKESEHSWINEASLLEFEGRDKYLDIVQYGLENPQRNSKPLGEFVISPAWYPAWSLAVTEAEAASKLGLEQRKLRYTFEYVVARGEAHKPVDELLKVIWFQSGGRRGDVEDKPESGDDDDGGDSLYNKLFGVQRQSACYDSDDFYSSDESSSRTEDRPPKPPVRVQVRPGLLEVFLHKQGPFLQERHPDWDPSFVDEYLKKQWSVMSSLQRSRYTTRHQKPLFVEVHRSQRSVSSRVDDLPTVDPRTLDLQIQKLSRKCHIARSEKSCLVCRQSGVDLVRCQGPCARYFHTACVQDVRDKASFCLQCHLNATVCFACKQPGAGLVQCGSLKCHKFYHEVCVAQLPLTGMDPAGFLCPLHVCATCQVEQRPGAREGSFIECLRCPTAYHSSDWCLVAGTQLTGRHHMLCANHFQPTRGCSQHVRVHVRGCLKCGHGGSLRQCQHCPAACHVQCEGRASPISSVDPRRSTINRDSETSPPRVEVWLCSHCLTGKKPLYGGIVWVKHGFYRWWPAEICHPHFVPRNVQVTRHQVGEFPVRFFGSHNFAWVHQGRVLSFNRGIPSLMDVARNVKDQVFMDALQEAAAAARFCASFDRDHQEM